MWHWFIDISWCEWLVLAVLLITLGCQVGYYAYYVGIVRRKGGKAERQKGGEENQPPVTVVVCAKNEEEHLEEYLHSLLTQDYPCYEVIVVNDGSMDRTEEVLAQYMKQDFKLRTTFVPTEARVMSSKKLALTLAAKAAKYDYLLLTDADCRPESNQWVSEIMRGFEDPKVDIVLGYGAYFEENTLLNMWIQYDTQFNGLHYLGAALRHQPYMGVGRNLAYRKEFFFRSGGFTDLMETRAGDDDLFVNKVANKNNTAVVVNEASVTWSEAKTTWMSWMEQKRRHLSVAPLYKRSTQWRLTVEPMTRGLFYASAIAGLIIGGPFVCGAVLLAILLRLIVVLALMNSATRAWRHPRWGIEIILLEITMPLVQAYLMATKWKYKGNRW